MVGIATLTMKASTPNMNCAATTIASTHQRRELSTGAETIWCMRKRLGPELHRTITVPGYNRDYLGGRICDYFGPIAACRGYYAGSGHLRCKPPHYRSRRSLAHQSTIMTCW